MIIWSWYGLHITWHWPSDDLELWNLIHLTLTLIQWLWRSKIYWCTINEVPSFNGSKVIASTDTQTHEQTLLKLIPSRILGCKKLLISDTTNFLKVDWLFFRRIESSRKNKNFLCKRLCEKKNTYTAGWVNVPLSTKSTNTKCTDKVHKLSFM